MTQDLTKDKKEILTDKFRIAFPNVFKAVENKLSKKPEYYFLALLPKGYDLEPLKAAVKAAAEEKWGPDPKKWPKPMRTPFKKQDEMVKKDEDGNPLKDEQGNPLLHAGCEAGAYYIRVKSNKKPRVVDIENQDIIQPEKFYAGCYARAVIKAHAYDVGAPGVSFWIQGIQKLADGEPLSTGGAFRAEEYFKPIANLQESSADSIF